MKDLNLLYAFEAIWRERSVSAAAEVLGVTQSATSGSLKKLRGEYDDKLFVQVGRRMEPTPLANELAPMLLDALAMIRRTRKEPANFEPLQSKRVFTIRTRDIGEVACFPRLVQRLRDVAPNVRIRSIWKPIDETLAGLASGQIDLAVGYLPALEAGIHGKSLFSQKYVTVLRKGHPLEGAVLTLDRFLTQEHLLVEYSGSGHVLLEKALIEAGAKDRIRLRLPQYLSAPHIVTSTDLIWVVPELLASELTKHFELVVKPLPLSVPEFDVAMYWHDRYHRDPASRWLREQFDTLFRTV
ncbi:LysR family transcriptional regulator [Paraburkholderia panacisoli]|uniref:LysR family transcriptional regulator n=1 Tax=Paraburkholderia panacisoli TaxID=2603818 RepID=A0A5B0GQ45_9BURK|nr:LysR family transcriptional regulator [Paraburkholderia panacisoli]KAA1004878.1 LysR family transcriptional regulator [Paraburkholderia panacisoli]